MTAQGTPSIALGASGIAVAPLGVGTWSWGDARFWGYGKEYGRAEIAEAFAASVAAGITLFDTAEVYGQGESECLLGGLLREMDATASAPIVVATKFAPLPWRFGGRSLRRALDASLERLGVARIDLYQIHFPYSLIGIPTLMDALADAVAEGQVRAVGVSNYGAEQMRRAHEALARRGVPLATNQVRYNLLCAPPGDRRHPGRLPRARRDADRLQPARSGLAHRQIPTGRSHPIRFPALAAALSRARRPSPRRVAGSVARDRRGSRRQDTGAGGAELADRPGGGADPRREE